MKKVSRRRRNPSLHALAVRAMRAGVQHAIEEHRRAGVPMVVFRDGKMVRIPASKLPRKLPKKRAR